MPRAQRETFALHFVDRSLSFLHLSLPFLHLSLPFLDLPLALHCLLHRSRWVSSTYSRLMCSTTPSKAGKASQSPRRHSHTGMTPHIVLGHNFIENIVNYNIMFGSKTDKSCHPWQAGQRGCARGDRRQGAVDAADAGVRARTGAVNRNDGATERGDGNIDLPTRWTPCGPTTETICLRS